MSVCQGCGTQLPPKTWQGRDQMWCSDRCRKDACYVHHCLDCGIQLNSSDGNGPNAPQRCNRCRGKRQQETTRAWILVSLHTWAEMFGTPPSATDWNPALARAHGCAWKADRHESTGRAWPSVWACQKHFGSWSKALEAAGFESRPPIGRHSGWPHDRF